MKFTHNLLFNNKKLSYKYDRENGVITYKYKNTVNSIYNYFGFCVEDEIKKDIELKLICGDTLK